MGCGQPVAINPLISRCLKCLTKIELVRSYSGSHVSHGPSEAKQARTDDNRQLVVVGTVQPVFIDSDSGRNGMSEVAEGDSVSVVEARQEQQLTNDMSPAPGQSDQSRPTDDFQISITKTDQQQAAGSLPMNTSQSDQPRDSKDEPLLSPVKSDELQHAAGDQPADSVHREQRQSADVSTVVRTPPPFYTVATDQEVVDFFESATFSMHVAEIEYMRNEFPSARPYHRGAANQMIPPGFQVENLVYKHYTYSHECRHAMTRGDPHLYCPVCDVTNGNLTCFSTPNNCEFCAVFTKEYAQQDVSHITKRRKERITENRSGTRWTTRRLVLPGPIETQDQAIAYRQLVDYSVEFKAWEGRHGPTRTIAAARQPIAIIAKLYLEGRDTYVKANNQPFSENLAWITCTPYEIIQTYRIDLLNHAAHILEMANQKGRCYATEHEMVTLRGLCAKEFSDRDISVNSLKFHVCFVALEEVDEVTMWRRGTEIVKNEKKRERQELQEQVDAKFGKKKLLKPGTSAVVNLSEEMENSAAVTRDTRSKRHDQNITPSKKADIATTSTWNMFNDARSPDMYPDYVQLRLPIHDVELDAEPESLAVLPLTCEAYQLLWETHQEIVSFLDDQPLKGKHGNWATITAGDEHQIPNTMFESKADVFSVLPEDLEQVDAEKHRAATSRAGAVTATGEEAELLDGLGRLSFKQSSDMWVLIGIIDAALDANTDPYFDASKLAMKHLIQVCGQHIGVTAKAVAFNTVIRRRGNFDAKSLKTDTQWDFMASVLKQPILKERDAAEEARRDVATPEYKHTFAYARVVSRQPTALTLPSFRTRARPGVVQVASPNRPPVTKKANYM